MATERQSPDALIVQTNLNGAVTDIDEDPDTPGADWLTYITNNVDTVTRVSFPTPTGNPTVGANLQQFKIWVRKKPGTGTPTVAISLYENGSLVSEVMTATNVTNSSGELFSVTWNANLLGTADGSLVECYIYGDAVGGAPAARCTVEVGAVEWNVTYDSIHYGVATLSGTGTLAGISALILKGLATLTGSGLLSTIGVRIYAGKATLTGSGLLATIGSFIHTASATLSGTGLLSAIGGVWKLGVVTLSGVGLLTAKGVGIFIASATLSGVGTLSAIGRRIVYGITTLSGTGVLSAISRLLLTAKATLSGSGVLITIGNNILVGITTLTGIGSLISKGVFTAIGKATLDGLGSLSAIGVTSTEPEGGAYMTKNTATWTNQNKS